MVFITSLLFTVLAVSAQNDLIGACNEEQFKYANQNISMPLISSHLNNTVLEISGELFISDGCTLGVRDLSFDAGNNTFQWRFANSAGNESIILSDTLVDTKTDRYPLTQVAGREANFDKPTHVWLVNLGTQTMIAWAKLPSEITPDQAALMGPCDKKQFKYANMDVTIPLVSSKTNLNVTIRGEVFIRDGCTLGVRNFGFKGTANHTLQWRFAGKGSKKGIPLSDTLVNPSSDRYSLITRANNEANFDKPTQIWLVDLTDMKLLALAKLPIIENSVESDESLAAKNSVTAEKIPNNQISKSDGYLVSISLLPFAATALVYLM